MTSQDYTRTFTAPVTPARAYELASAPASWWGEMATGTPDTPGSTFVFNVPELHYSLFDVTEAIPGQRLAWTVIPSGNPAEHHEWVGTEVRMDFEPDPAGSRITFTHKGLRPTLNCHAVCSAAWDHHLEAGLRALLTTGRGEPLTYATIAEVANKIGAAGAA